MNPIMTSLFLSTIAMSTILTMSSFHWLLAWIGLELNTLAIIPILAKQHHPRATEATTKYFLTQAAASAVLLFASTTNAWTTGTWDITQLTNEPACIMLTMALSMKLGLAPLHFWLPEVLQGTPLSTALIITTWQKLAPISLLYMTHNAINPPILLTMGILSTLVGGWGGLNQTQTRKIMAFSSVAHLGWMASIATINPNILLINLFLYIIMTTTAFMMLIYTSSKTIKDLTTSWMISPPTTAMMLILLMSLGGLPPLTGFVPKWLILQELTTNHLSTTATIMALSALLSLFFYLRIAYTSALTTFPTTTQSTNKWRFSPKSSTTVINLMLLPSILILPMTPMLMQ
uniref:NADH-ubiquinone oxidoreductase chain 2 n=1 Tax=Lamprolepis smaragdina TaxID=96745 RepID=L0BX55_LAMSM|nr:NADH dehydrogenase subunit 2 [Lamprolepis smaragdina]AFZ93797.1 NADH dehydrogenase subunit 2 [Lamprolepis smaragdina]AFZ93799.1 NADH dehydrogenase subunit 2 [Lamprolepis smaragdina]AFZ93800.1 NADH dehydrogenase subunit 2 [Lamprolepis smaragdina]AFZ93801.1 NADH dehydrogenase subunit 2 [Lamprolepis smaragdina]